MGERGKIGDEIRLIRAFRKATLEQRAQILNFFEQDRSFESNSCGMISPTTSGDFPG